MSVNRQVVLASRPNGNPVVENFRLEEAAIPTPADGEMLVRNLNISMEPAIRGWLDDNDANYFEPLKIGEAIRAPTIGEVIESRNPKYKVGDLVRGLNAWQDYSIVTDATILLEKVVAAADMPLTYYSGPLGGSGLTAVVGLEQIGRIKAGDTLVISAALGAVGHIAAQYAKSKGCRVVGLVGSASKAQLAIDVIGYDAVINYRETADLVAAVKAACPEGVDVYFDNVGGETLDAMLLCMNTFGRIIGCGMIAGYNQQDQPPALYNMWQMIARQLEMKGFLLYTYAEFIPAALKSLEAGVREGRFKVLENKMVGLDKAATLFCDLMAGKTTGKSVLEIDRPELA